MGSLLKMLSFHLIGLSQCNIFQDAQKVFMSLTLTGILKSQAQSTFEDVGPIAAVWLGLRPLEPCVHEEYVQ